MSKFFYGLLRKEEQAMKKKFAVAISVDRVDLPGELAVCVVEANSTFEAEGIGDNYARLVFPVEDDWCNHTVVAEYYDDADAIKAEDFEHEEEEHGS